MAPKRLVYVGSPRETEVKLIEIDKQYQEPSAALINALQILSFFPRSDIHTEHFQRMFSLEWAEMVSDYSRL